MCDPDQLDGPGGGTSEAASGEPDDELEPYSLALTNEEREELRREWLAAVRAPVPKDAEKPGFDGFRHAVMRRTIR
jgi:hypothetical protein